jgi:lipopolysaccharide export LptBFGC system permease protein LptF
LKHVARRFIRGFASRYDWYFYREIAGNYGFGLLFLTALILLNQIFGIAKLYFEYNVPLDQVLLLLFNQIPFVMSFSIPFAVLPGYLITMGRFSMDGEVVALKSCGVSVGRIIKPGLIFGIFICFFAFLFKDQVEMPANMNYVLLYMKVMSQKPAVELMENQFLELGGYKINFARMEQEGDQHILYDIHLIDIAGRKTIEADKGRLFTDPEDPSRYTLKLVDGSMSEVMKSVDDKGAKEEKFFIAGFKYLAINRFVTLPQGYVTKSPESLTYSELKKNIDEQSREIFETIKKLDADKAKIAAQIEELTAKYRKEIDGLDPAQAETKTKNFQFNEALLKNNIVGIDKNIDSFYKGLPFVHMRVFQEKFSMPAAALLFAFISLSYGLFTARSGRNEGLGVSLLVVMLYFGMKMGVAALVDNGSLPLAFVWLPNLLFLTAGVVLFARKASV